MVRRFGISSRIRAQNQLPNSAGHEHHGSVMGIPSQYLGPVFLFLGVVIILFIFLLTLTSCYVHGSDLIKRQATIRRSRKIKRKEEDEEGKSDTKSEQPANED